MKRLVIVATLALSGCGFTAQGNFVRDVVRVKGAQAEDAGVQNALWFLCNAASVGAIQRKFGKSVAQAELYKQMCKGQLEANPIGANDAVDK